jgi:threonine/homoserine/homoserine lactone efflux protein
MSFGLVSIMVTVVVAHLLALISPGPDFLMIVRSSLRNQKGNAIGVALGIALANGIYITLCIVGIGSILAASLVLMTILKVVGGAFLLYIAFHALRSRKRDYAQLVSADQDTLPSGHRGFQRELAAGFLSGLSNPKNIIFYLSLFSVVLTNEVGLAFRVGLGVWMTTAVFLWDSFIVVVLTQERVRRVFVKMAFYVDKVAGTLLGLIGVKLIETAFVKDGKL